MHIDQKKGTGIVVALKANFLIVEINNNFYPSNTYLLDKKVVRLLCTKRSRLSFNGSFVCVGDVVKVESIDWKRLRGVVSKVESRKSFINRPPVANLSHVLIAISLKEPLLDQDQISRFLLTAEQTGQKIIVILTKRDLIEKDKLEEYSFRLKEWGYESSPVSIINGQGIASLYKKLETIQLGVLCGPSGVGKSSLINYLLPTISIPIGNLSKKLKRGTHKTRHVELFSLLNGALIADTPGFNKPTLCVKPSDLSHLFPEFRYQLKTSNCKFRNCLHLNEPGCGISKNWERYENYKKYMDELSSSRH